MSNPDALVRAALEKHAKLIGHITISWNSAQSLVFVLFCILSRLTLEEAQAVFFSLKADTAQRDMTRELGRVVLASNKELAKEFADAFAKLQDLSSLRNAATHTMWSVLVLESRLTPSPFVPPHKKLVPERTAEQFAQLQDDLDDVNGKLVALTLKAAQHVASLKKLRERQQSPPSTQ